MQTLMESVSTFAPRRGHWPSIGAAWSGRGGVPSGHVHGQGRGASLLAIDVDRQRRGDPVDLDPHGDRAPLKQFSLGLSGLAVPDRAVGSMYVTAPAQSH